MGTVQPVTGTANDAQYDVQPPSPEEEATGDGMHEGTLDEHGGFIGVVVASIGAEQDPTAVTIESTSDEPSD